MDPVEMIEQFVASIDAHDVDALCARMTNDHRRVDSLGNEWSGRDDVRTAWAKYLALVRGDSALEGRVFAGSEPIRAAQRRAEEP